MGALTRQLIYWERLDVLMKDDGSDSAEEGILSDCLSDAAFAINEDNHNAEFFDFIKSDQDDLHHRPEEEGTRYNFRPRTGHQTRSECSPRPARPSDCYAAAGASPPRKAAPEDDQTPEHLIRFCMVRDRPRRRSNRRRRGPTGFLKRLSMEEDGTFYLPERNVHHRLPTELRRSRRPHREVCYNERSLFSAEFSDPDPEPEARRPCSDPENKDTFSHHRHPDQPSPQQQQQQQPSSSQRLKSASNVPLTERIAGMEEYLQRLKEMIVFPLLYPGVFNRLGISPPRGVLFHGPPGTGKTLLARLLAESCSIPGSNRKVSFFMKNGSDCLSKWIGEAEKNLRQLFHKAREQQPSIIFFDEIDGLAPERTGRQDQSHISLVATLLALLDGLDDRGNVVVIGATNRIDSLDAALRRPGRFDREFYFGLPNRHVRRDILEIHTATWQPPASPALLDRLAEATVDYSGADLKALCVEAALTAIRRDCPRAYDLWLPPPTAAEVADATAALAVREADFLRAFASVVPSSRRQVTNALPESRPLQLLFSGVAGQIVERIRDLCYHDDERTLREGRRSIGFTEPMVAIGIGFGNLLGPHHLRLLSSMVAAQLGGGEDHLGVTCIHAAEVCDEEEHPRRAFERLLPRKRGGGEVVLLAGLGQYYFDEHNGRIGKVEKTVFTELQRIFFADSPYLLVLLDANLDSIMPGTTAEELEEAWYMALQVDWGLSFYHLEIDQASLEAFLNAWLQPVAGPEGSAVLIRRILPNMKNMRDQTLSLLEVALARTRRRILLLTKDSAQPPASNQHELLVKALEGPLLGGICPRGNRTSTTIKRRESQ